MTIPPGMKIAAQMSPEPREEDLRFVQQLGIEWVTMWTTGERAGHDYYASRKELFEQHGLHIYGFGNLDVHCQDAFVLGLPNRDQKIEEYKRHLRALGRAGIPYTTYAHMANSVWSTPAEETRGGARTRAFDLARVEAGELQHPTAYPLPLTHGREYTEEELWDHFTYFVRQVVPVAEEAGVLIGIHPDDPPLPRLGGVPRLFSTFGGYIRALEIANSPNVGVCLCLGCWLEGADQMGATPEEAIRYFGSQKKLFKIHFRNVDRPLPHFRETFVDDGYADMYPFMEALREVDFPGVMIPDHVPQMVGGRHTGTAFTIGYMKALLRRATADSNR